MRRAWQLRGESLAGLADSPAGDVSKPGRALFACLSMKAQPRNHATTRRPIGERNYDLA
jgi:hypothetical protein